MRLRIVAVVASISGIIGGLVGAGAIQVFDNGGSDTTVSAPTSAVSDSTGSGSSQVALTGSDCQSAADIYEQVRPAVVQITSLAGRSGGTGTGIIIDDKGNILTNHHVISDATSIEVRFSDGSTSSAEVIGSDPANDIAVIHVTDNGLDLVAANLGDSDALRVGDSVLAIGNPFDLEGTLTQGIVSAIGRDYATGGNTRPIRGMIQTDAAVNPGNSGGPLLNCRGEVVGVNSLLENPSGGNVNVGVAFAVAINTAKRSLPQMVAGDSISHPWLGIAGMDVTPALAQELGLGTNSGVYVTLVSSGSPADQAGLHGAFTSENQAAASDAVRPSGDVILTADGKDVTGIDQLARYLDENKKASDSVELTVSRDGKTISVTAQLAEWPS